MRDVERATTAPGAPKPSVKKMCLVFSIVIMIWFAVLVYIISGVKAPDRQSYYMDNLDFKANSIATPSSHAHPHPNPDCRAASLLATTHTLILTLASPLVSQGADIDSIFGVETASACYKRCEEHESCLAYTYVKSEHVCWLKGEGYTSKPNSNTVSGAINSTLAALRRNSAVNGSYNGFDGGTRYPEWDQEGEHEHDFDSTRADEWDNDDDYPYRSEADEEGERGAYSP